VLAQILAEATSPPYEFVERGETGLLRDYLPEAPGVIFPGEPVLSAARYVAGSNRPHGWSRPFPGNFRKYVGTHILMVRQSGGPRSKHWIIERLDENYNTEALVLSLGPSPMFAHNYQAATRLAEHCHHRYPNVGLPIPGCWMVARRRQ